MLNRSPLFLLFFLVFVLWPFHHALAINDPTLVWKTISTPHARVHAPEHLLPIAKRVAEVTEHAYSNVSPALGWNLTEIVEIALTDNTDSANGSATPVPYNAIRLFVTAPDDLSTLSDYDDWLLTLVTHELTHVVHLDNVTGILAIYNAIFGKTYTLNAVQPKWFIEGLAVLYETKLTSGGRNRSTLFDMYLRADVLEDNVAPIDQISNNPRRWPQGTLWYLYGSHFLEYIENLYGPEAMRSVVSDYGSQIIPYGVNRSIRRATGHTYIELYQSWVSHMQRKYTKQRNELIKRGLREGRQITFHGQSAFHPRYTPTSSSTRTLTYYRSDGHSTSGLYEINSNSNAKNENSKLIIRTAGESTPVFLPQGGMLYDSIEINRQIYTYWDLFYHSAEDDGAQYTQGLRLSKGLRANEPTVSPKGDQVAFRVNNRGTSFLYLASLDLKKKAPLGNPVKIVDSNAYEQIYTPRFSPDGKRIAFSRWSTGGNRDICIITLASRKVDCITHDRALDTGPVFSPDNKTLYFSSDRTGIANIYAYTLDGSNKGKLRQVTNVVNGAFQPDISPDGKHLVYVGYTHKGHDLFELPLDESKFLDPLLYKDHHPSPLKTKPYSIPESAITSYNPWSTFRPYSWDFSLTPDAFGSQALTVVTRGGDIAGYHGFSAALGTNFSRGDLAFDVSYGYYRLPFDASIRTYRYVAPRGGYRFSGQTPTWIEQNIGVETALRVPIPTAFTSQSLAVSQTFFRFKPLDELPKTYNPYSLIPIFPQTGYFNLMRVGYAFSALQSFLWSVGAAKGFAGSMGMTFAGRALGSDYDLFSLDYNLAAYIPMPWLQHHVLALHAQGAFSTTNSLGRGLYAIGGFADIPLPDALRNLIGQPSIALRGYKPSSIYGNTFQLYNAEYRFPVVNIDRGLSTLPIFLNRIYGNAFVDYGMASFAPINLARMKVGVGLEALTDFTIGYFVGLTLRVGVARGLSDGGQWQWYTVLSQLF